MPYRNLSLPVFAVILTAALLFSGCGTLNRLMDPLNQVTDILFSSASFADLQVVGVKTGSPIPIQADAFGTSATLGEEARQELVSALGQASLGVLFPITEIGKTNPWWIFCPAGEMQKRCEEIPAHARVTFTGRPLHGVVFLPTHLAWSGQ